MSTQRLHRSGPAVRVKTVASIHRFQTLIMSVDKTMSNAGNHYWGHYCIVHCNTFCLSHWRLSLYSINCPKWEMIRLTFSLSHLLFLMKHQKFDIRGRGVEPTIILIRNLLDRVWWWHGYWMGGGLPMVYCAKKPCPTGGERDSDTASEPSNRHYCPGLRPKNYTITPWSKRRKYGPLLCSMEKL